MSVIKIENLKKSYGRVEAVKGVSLEIEKGELFVLLGPNGAGKTTTLKMITGLLNPTSGSVHINGIDRAARPMDAKKQLSFVPDIPYVYDKLSPLELLRFTGKLYEMNSKEIEGKSEELLSFFSLWDVRNVLIEEFSHGMKQKAVLASALLHGPKALILDEPMVGLDPVSIKSFKDFMKKKTKEGMTILFSTHTLSTAEELADRIAIMNQGRLAALGSIKELRGQFESEGNLESMFMRLVGQNL